MIRLVVSTENYMRFVNIGLRHGKFVLYYTRGVNSKKNKKKNIWIQRVYILQKLDNKYSTTHIVGITK